MTTTIHHLPVPAAMPRFVDPFDGFFDREGGAPAPAPGSLLDTGEARAWFEHLAWGVEQGLYGYQQPVEAVAGVRVRSNGRWLLSLSSYDYLGLRGHPAVAAGAVAAVRRYGTGSGGVRLLTGTLELHRALERDLAAFKGTEACLVLGSGYLANLAALTALLGPRDRAIIDAKVHRSIVDGCRLAGVPTTRFAHNDLQHLERALAAGHPRGRTLIVVEGAYSMDGDLSPLPGVVELKRRCGAFLMVDDAHSFGTLGETGRGADEHWGLPGGAVDVWTGSLSKAIPAGGGFVAGSRALMVFLQHAAAPFIFSAALCPSAVGAARAALAVLRSEPERAVRACHNGAELRRRLGEMGYDTGSSTTPIIPVLLGPREAAYRAARRLFELGVAVSAVTYPAVAPTNSRLRLCATAGLSDPDLDTALDAFRTLRQELDLPHATAP